MTGRFISCCKGLVLLPAAFSLALAFCMQKSALGKDVAWETYANARFSYAVEYPAALLLPQGESVNGDGQAFVSADGQAEMLAFAGYNVLETSLEQAYGDMLLELSGVTYKTMGDSWFVVSGVRKGAVYYRWTKFQGGKRFGLWLEYPEIQKEKWDPLVRRIVKSFVIH